VLRRAGGKPIRAANKSVRCQALLERVLAREGFVGVMSFTLTESLWLARSGLDDVLLACPSADRAGFAELTSDSKLVSADTVMIGDLARLRLIDGGREVVRVCLELDTSLKLLSVRVRAVTVPGGGYPVSGAAGHGRLPVPYLPEGLRYRVYSQCTGCPCGSACLERRDVRP
jgi:D-serine deaminase-like pyridoxal phosphate-dependent protein